MTLYEKRENVFSQKGEDGIIKEILNIIPEIPHWCVEFGAWDGKHLSNTYALMESGWHGVFIEGDKNRFKDLEKTYVKNNKAHLINSFVGFSGSQTLDALLQQTPIPQSFGLLSIDIDGNDYHVWKACSYKPYVVVIEYNPSIPPHIEFVQEANPSVNQGSSLQSLVLLGKSKGYELVTTTELNAFFVRTDFFDRFGILDNSPQSLYKGHAHRIELFQLYDGTLVLLGDKKFHWHGVYIGESFQRIPRVFRVFPERMNPVQKLFFKVWRKIHNAYINLFS